MLRYACGTNSPVQSRLHPSGTYGAGRAVKLDERFSTLEDHQDPASLRSRDWTVRPARLDPGVAPSLAARRR